MSEPRELETHEVCDRVTALFRYAQVGLCVNSVTHDINNYLGAILAYAELVDMSEALSPEGRRMMREIIEGVRRCTSLLNPLTVIARREKPSVTVVDPVRLLEQVVELRSHDLRFQRIQLDQESAPDVPSFVADHPKLELALMYLLTNACEAVDGDKRVRVGVHYADDLYTFTFWNSGSPLPDDAPEAIFHPFTTAKDGSHLGLGLAMARDIAAQHDGTLTYSPAQGFVMALPYKNRFAEELP